MSRVLRAPWPGRVVGLLVAWLVIGGILAWVGSDPSWLGVLGAVTALAGFAWLVIDVGDLAATGWTTEHPVSSDRPTLDGRLGTLRRLADAAGETPSDGSSTRPAAAEVQSILRRATDLRARATGADVPEDLADYLAARPAPLISSTQLDRLLTRIEAL